MPANSALGFTLPRVEAVAELAGAAVTALSEDAVDVLAAPCAAMAAVVVEAAAEAFEAAEVADAFVPVCEA